MTFSTDRDLLALEPAVFNDVLFAGQKRLEVSDGVVSGTTLTSASADFEAAQLDAGDVVLIAGVPCEVVARVNSTTLTISKLRANLSDVAIPPGNGSSLVVIHRTFEPQARLAHDELLRLLGIDPEGDDDLNEDSIISLSIMRELETLATLARIHEAAIALDNADNHEMHRAKAVEYHQAYRGACRRGLVSLDLDGDGVADTVRDLRIIGLRRI